MRASRALTAPFGAMLLLACASDVASDGESDDSALVEAPPPAAPATPSLADIAGLSAYPPRCVGHACDEGRRRVFALMKDLGVHHLRTDLNWQEVEPARGERDFTGLDAMVDGAVANGIELLGILVYGASWATTHHDEYYPPDRPDDYVDFAKAVATRYDGKIRRYEVWNEPNNGWRFWKSKFGGDAAAFGDLTRRTAEALHALPLKAPVKVAPGGTVYISQWVPIPPFGTIPPGVDFARDAFAENPTLAAATDAFAFHAYNVYPPHAAPESKAVFEVPFDEKVRATKAMLDGAGAGDDRPLWLTEIGWPTANFVSEDAQARWCVRSILLGALHGLSAVYLFTLYDDVSPPRLSFAPEGSFGLAHADGSPKAAFRAVKALLSTLGRHHFTERVEISDAPDDVHVLAFADGASRASAAWRSNDFAGPWTWRPAAEPGHDLVVYGMHGRTIDAGGGVAVTRDPVYLIER